MGKVYSIQWFHLYFGYTTLPGTFANCRIKYRRPDGVTGYFAATHDSVGKQFYYNSAVAEPYTKVGKWTFWGLVTIDTGEEIPSEPITREIYKEGY